MFSVTVYKGEMRDLHVGVDELVDQLKIDRLSAEEAVSGVVHVLAAESLLVPQKC